MKTSLALVVLLLAPVALFAQNGPPAHRGPGVHAALHAGDELAVLDQFLGLSNAELDQLQQAIARVRAMSPAERAALKEKIVAYRQLPENQRQQVRRGWGFENDQDRQDWPTMMHAKTDDERATVQKELQALPPEQRAARKHELLEAWRAASSRP
ncbi:hypothetical protein DB347_11970 [Opitutaceae bacterium EW11]|nr:hypothetical protein DB347_11970 [Opitutaceae bacterium EW11]